MSTSSSEPTRRWRRFIGLLLGLTAAAVSLMFVFVALVDPYASLAFSPHWKRYRVTSNERYAFPGLIRHGRFDSAVFGTSTVMLLKPEGLDKKLGGHFANLAMASGTAWEQAQVMAFFASHSRVRIRSMIVAIDVAWCAPATPSAHLTARPFPPWEFDDDPFNDYAHLLNTRAVAHAGLQLLAMTGLRPSPYADDGYFQFTPDDERYDPARARALLYQSDAAPRAADLQVPQPSPRPANWTFPDLAMLASTLDVFPVATRKTLMFVPYHLAHVATQEEWSRYTYCKSAAVALAQMRPNVTVIDFMRPSALTRDDHAYWDPLHFRIGRAADIIGSLQEAFVADKRDGALYRVLWRPPGAPAS